MISLSSLCKACNGKCCNGTLYKEVLIRKSEVTKLRSLGAKVERDIPFSDMIMPVPQGCKFLINGQCSIYKDRPLSCRVFDCRKSLQFKWIVNNLKKGLQSCT